MAGQFFHASIGTIDLARVVRIEENKDLGGNPVSISLVKDGAHDDENVTGTEGANRNREGHAGNRDTLAGEEADRFRAAWDAFHGRSAPKGASRESA